MLNKSEDKNVVAFITTLAGSAHKTLLALEKQLDRELSGIILVDSRSKKTIKSPTKKIKVLKINTNSSRNIEKVLKPYESRLLAMTCRSEAQIPMFRKIIPHVPYIRTPTEKSLEWSTDKLSMRKMLASYDRSISPRYTVVEDDSDESIQKIVKKVGFPLIVKPAGLAQSLLVSECYYEEELISVLKTSFKKLRKIYKEKKGRGEPQLLVEQLMEGSMYSIDAYVDSRGQIHTLPLVHVRTGKSIGFDDFFGYQRLTPVKLKPHRQQIAREVAVKGILALKLRNVTCHIELMRTEDGWKIIEIGPRIGGFRHGMYKESFGIDHSLNDVLIRIPKKPIIPRKVRGYTAVLQFYGRKEGTLETITGINKAKKLESMSKLTVHKKKGDRCKFARHGGTSVFDVRLFNPNRSRLLADIRRLEKSIKIEVKKRKPSNGS